MGWIESTIKVIEEVKERRIEDDKVSQAYDKGCVDTLQSLKRYLEGLMNQKNLEGFTLH